MRPIFKYCLVIQLVLAIYFQLIVWFRLGKLNAQSGFTPAYELLLGRKLALEDIGFLIIFIIPVLVFYAGYKKNKYWLMIPSMVFYLVWLLLQLNTWWRSYIFGASDKWYEVYNRTFLNTHKILPGWGRHLPPDTMHLVIQVLLLLIIYLFVKASLKFRKLRPGSVNR